MFQGETCGRSAICWSSWVWRSPLLPCDPEIRSTTLEQAKPTLAQAAQLVRQLACPRLQLRIPMRRAPALPTTTAIQELPRTPTLDLVRQLQHELTRVGCYAGDIN